MKTPLVSVILPTRDRPTFLPVALRCIAEQSYPAVELIVVDSGERVPADDGLVRAHGGRLIRVDPETPLGEMLNVGARAARGVFLQKVDDDDWYAPALIERLMAEFSERWSERCAPMIAGIAPYLVLLLAKWSLHRAPESNFPGATLCVPRSLWQERPFRPLATNEDATFYIDQKRLGTTLLRVNAPELFVALRHGGAGGDRGHSWVEQKSGPVDNLLGQQPRHDRKPEAVLPRWVINHYRAIRIGEGWQ